MSELTIQAPRANTKIQARPQLERWIADVKPGGYAEVVCGEYAILRADSADAMIDGCQAALTQTGVT